MSPSLYQLILFVVIVLLTTEATSPAPTRFKSLLYNWKGYNIRYCQKGPEDGQPLILIHGFGASLDYYRKQIPAFAENGYSVYAIDLLGFGGSEKAIKPLGKGYSASLWANQILDFYNDVVVSKANQNANQKNKQKVILAGNSIGSRIALEAALLAPDSIRGLLLYNAAAGINNKFTLTDTLTPLSIKLFAIPIFTLLDVLLKNEGFSSWLFERTRKPENILSTLQSVYSNKESCDEELVNSIATAAQDPNALKVFVEILTQDAGKTPDTFMEKISCPIKFIWGNADPFTPLDGPYGLYFQNLCKLRRDTSMTVVTGGHCPHDDFHEEANTAALQWLKELS
jgi:pimeloyl-ACP methyl ester carboxylesterase